MHIKVVIPGACVQPGPDMEMRNWPISSMRCGAGRSFWQENQVPHHLCPCLYCRLPGFTVARPECLAVAGIHCKRKRRAVYLVGFASIYHGIRLAANDLPFPCPMPVPVHIPAEGLFLRRAGRVYPIGSLPQGIRPGHAVYRGCNHPIAPGKGCHI